MRRLTLSLSSQMVSVMVRRLLPSPARCYHSKVDYTGSSMDANTAFQLDRYSKYIPASISIKHLLDHGKTANQLGSYVFLKKEIPTRLANMIKELQLLPADLKKQKECSQILNDYISSFREVIEFKEDAGDDRFQNFANILNNIRRRHLDTVPKMATAVFKMQSINSSEGVGDTVQYFLDRLYINRISIHMLISQHNALLGEEKTLTGMVGTIDQSCDILAVCEEAYQAAAVLCDREYLDHPELEAMAMDTTDENVATMGKVSAAYVPAHLHHILFEIFKNSMRATVEHAEKQGKTEIPPISVRIFKTKNDITVKISDVGGGISRNSSGKIFNYMYSTAPQVVIPEGGGSLGAGLSAETLPMHGLGYGLPLSRLYFKGDIQIASVDGYGTDVFVYLQRLSHLAQENLPVYNAVSSAKLRNSATQVHDWTDLH